MRVREPIAHALAVNALGVARDSPAIDHQSPPRSCTLLKNLTRPTCPHISPTLITTPQTFDKRPSSLNPPPPPPVTVNYRYELSLEASRCCTQDQCGARMSFPVFEVSPKHISHRRLSRNQLKVVRSRNGRHRSAKHIARRSQCCHVMQKWLRWTGHAGESHAQARIDISKAVKAPRGLESMRATVS